MGQPQDHTRHGRPLHRPVSGQAVSLVAVAAASAAHDMVVVHEDSATVAYAHIFDDPFPRGEALTRWRHYRGAVILGVVNDGAVGFVAADGDVLDALYVVPAFAGRGLGSALLQAIRPVNRLWVLEQNLRARRFYERRGWRRSGEARIAGDAGDARELRYVCD